MDITEMIKNGSQEQFPYSEPYGDFINLNERQSHRREGFRKGASFATTDSDMLMSLLKPFAEWMEKEYEVVQCPTCALTKYIQHITETIKQKQDGSFQPKVNEPEQGKI